MSDQTIPDSIVSDPVWKRVRITDACWPYMGARTPAGYGRMWRKGKYVYPHRVVAELTSGPIPAGMFVCHTCDNPPCCRPDHLFIGTPSDNSRDRDNKGRGARPCILTSEQVSTARDLRRSGLEVSEIAERIGVDKSLLYRAIRGASWKSLPGAVASDRTTADPLYFVWLRLQSDVLKRQIREGANLRALARSLGIGKTTLDRIVNDRVRPTAVAS